jgi:hypothetical protein
MFSDLGESELVQLEGFLARVRAGLYQRYLTDDVADETVHGSAPTD